MSLTIEVKKRYHDFTLDITLENTSRRLGLLGASGSGKSMTLRSIAGIETPDEGKIILADRILYHSKTKINLTPGKRKIGFMFQNYALFPHMTVKENIEIGITDKKNRKRITDEMFQLFRLGDMQNKYPWQLSGGQQQRVALARILAYEPEALLLDEPFSALDTFLKEQVQQELIESLRDYSGDIVMVSHNREELFRFCQDIAVLDQGKIVASGSVKDVFDNPGKTEAARLLGCKNISRAYKLSDHVVAALDWKINLLTDQFVENDINYVGIREYDIRPGQSDRIRNTLPVKLVSYSEGYKSKNFIFQNLHNKSESQKIWLTMTRFDWEQKLKKEIPSYLMFPKEHILLLR